MLHLLRYPRLDDLILELTFSFIHQKPTNQFKFSLKETFMIHDVQVIEKFANKKLFFNFVNQHNFCQI